MSTQDTATRLLGGTGLGSGKSPSMDQIRLEVMHGPTWETFSIEQRLAAGLQLQLPSLQVR